ncbi:MAG: Omp28 family outer membrane lipoprotein [Bacteroidales bacterium]|nr:Omp28 family outer membrane lipoprotein [Bacteroidales bacterium]
MKKILIFLSIAFIFMSCNKIQGPYVTKSGQSDVDVEFPKLDTNAVYRKILFEEYTGHCCIGCPEGHDILAQQKSIYGDTLIPVCIHAGYFAEPENGLFSYDFRSTAGEELNTDFSITNNPQAIINRVPGPLDKSSWAEALRSADRTKYAAIQIINIYDNDDDVLGVYTKTTMLRDYPGQVKMSLFLIEDNIIKPQKYSDHIDTNYVHNHVLRYGINGTYGEIVSANGYVQKDSSYLYGYLQSFYLTDWVPEKCSVVAILWDQQEKKILQTETKKVK